MKPPIASDSNRRSTKTKKEKRDVDVMNTNDSSITSKRCVCKLYFSNEPDWYEPFVPKYLRRNPLINRGYWLRMHAIEQAVHQFLQEDTKKLKVVVNLGCGYDPLPFQLWHRYPSLTKNATFVDVDYPQLIERKRDRMLTNNLLRDELIKTNLLPSKPPVYLRTSRYMAVGCDLRDIDLLEQIFRAEFDVSAMAVLFLAEVSLTYMPVTDANTLIKWASTLQDARFAMLEQYLPQGPEHPFAQTMLSHFDKLQTPIKAVGEYPSLAQQSSRFRDAGWATVVSARALWDLWLDTSFIPLASRRGLDVVEPFDEWEEFALFAGHYFLLVASNTEEKQQTEVTVGKSDTSTPSLKTVDPDTIIVHSEIQPSDAMLTPRRFLAAFALGQSNVVLHAGQGTRERLSTVDVLSREDFQPGITLPPLPACMCHTITPMSNATALLVGGRMSPMQALTDTWFLNNQTWTKVGDLETARYRHCAVPIVLKHQGSETTAVLVFGGKTSKGEALDDWVLWTVNDGWQSLSVNGPGPLARFGAAMAVIASDASRQTHSVGLLMGGMSADGAVLEDVWEWSVLAAPTPRLTLKNRTNNVHNKTLGSISARVGAGLVPWGDQLLLIGGVSKGQLHSRLEDFLLVSHDQAEIVVNGADIHFDSTWPLLIGMAAISVSSDEVVIAGGGAVCFSMGSFWNQNCLKITRCNAAGLKSWRVVPQQNYGKAQRETAKAPHQGKQNKRKKPRFPHIAETPRVQLQSPEDFRQLIAASKPAIIEGLDIGPCTELWSLDYLKEKIGPERELVVHECASNRMTFKDKNFEYLKMSAGDFLDGIGQGKHSYLRAVSSSQPNKLPTKLEEDFPTIAQDFQIPSLFDIVRSNLHSSPLRISGPVSLWLHYDVLANVLCQIRATKTLRLYPPADVKHLDFPPGGSSSNLDVLTSKKPQLRMTHPQVAWLKPGDILFIPPAWSHTASPDQGFSVAVNVFWRDLDKGYAAGKDVYGNRDLQAYENGRRDVEKITRAFRDVPPQLARFYLQRLAREIQDKADALGKKKQVETKENVREQTGKAVAGEGQS